MSTLGKIAITFYFQAVWIWIKKTEEKQLTWTRRTRITLLMTRSSLMRWWGTRGLLYCRGSSRSSVLKSLRDKILSDVAVTSSGIGFTPQMGSRRFRSKEYLQIYKIEMQNYEKNCGAYATIRHHDESEEERAPSCSLASPQLRYGVC